MKKRKQKLSKSELAALELLEIKNNIDNVVKKQKTMDQFISVKNDNNVNNNNTAATVNKDINVNKEYYFQQELKPFLNLYRNNEYQDRVENYINSDQYSLDIQKHISENNITFSSPSTFFSPLTTSFSSSLSLCSLSSSCPLTSSPPLSSSYPYCYSVVADIVLKNHQQNVIKSNIEMNRDVLIKEMFEKYIKTNEYKNEIKQKISTYQSSTKRKITINKERKIIDFINENIKSEIAELFEPL